MADKKPKATIEDGVPPPNSMSVESQPKVVLYDHQGKPLTRKIGF